MQGYVVHVDFTSLHERACTDDDYESWSSYDDDIFDDWCRYGWERIQRKDHFKNLG